jgi:predicted membrane protein DUF2306
MTDVSADVLDVPHRADRATPGRRPSTLTKLLLATASTFALWFLLTNWREYLGLDEASFGRYWPVRNWLIVHILAGTVALGAGPGQIWLGLTRTRLDWHRRIGVVYVIAVAFGSVSAIGLAVQTQLGWVFGFGLLGLAAAWVITTALAYVSIRCKNMLQHQEWMVRSYIVTFAFVTFRIFTLAFSAAGIGTGQERATAASWFCWAIPLLIAEPFLQWRKLSAKRR